MQINETMTTSNSSSRERRSVWGIVRMSLGMAQMVGALCTGLLPLTEGMSTLTKVVFRVTTTQLQISLFPRYLGCWEGENRL